MKKKFLLIAILVPLLLVSVGGIALGRWIYVNKQLPIDVVVPSDKLVIPARVQIDLDTINLSAKGDWVTAYIEISAREWFPDADVTKIDVKSVQLDIYPQRDHNVSAENSPNYDFVVDPALYITDHDSDGKPERMVKFNLALVQDILPLGDGIPVEISGSLNDGTPFYGLTFVKVRGRFWLF